MVVDYKTIVLDGELDIDITLDGELALDVVSDGECGIITEVIKSDYPYYAGQTTVDPDFVGKTLETAQKIVMSDITVNPIQVESVSNLSGGRTVYIGGTM